MAEQRTFAGIAWSQKGKVTRRERFLAEMDAVIPWAKLRALIAPYYPKAGQGRQPLGLEKILRIYFLQQWFNLSDPQAEDAIYDSEAMRRFARVELVGRRRARRDDDPALPPPARDTPPDRGALRDGQGAAHREAVAAQERHDRRRDDHRRAQLDEECGPGARSRDEADPQGEHLVLRDEAARRDGRAWPGPQCHRDPC